MSTFTVHTLAVSNLSLGTHVHWKHCQSQHPPLQLCQKATPLPTIWKPWWTGIPKKFCRVNDGNSNHISVRKSSQCSRPQSVLVSDAPSLQRWSTTGQHGWSLWQAQWFTGPHGPSTTRSHGRSVIGQHGSSLQWWPWQHGWSAWWTTHARQHGRSTTGSNCRSLWWFAECWLRLSFGSKIVGGLARKPKRSVFEGLFQAQNP